MKSGIVAIGFGLGITALSACSNAPNLAKRPDRAERPSRAEIRPAEDVPARELAEGLLDRFAADRWSMPLAGSRLTRNGSVYAWDLTETPARASEDTRGHALRARQAGDARLADRLQRVQVRVWLAEPSGGSDTFDRNIAHAMVVRVVDPLAFSHSETLDTEVNDPQGLGRVMDLQLEMEAGGSFGMKGSTP